MPVRINLDTCTGCEVCVGVCPTEALSMVDGKSVVDEAACIDCGACLGVCPVEAITQ